MTIRSIAIVPARGGSKGVPGKNKRRVGGKPLIAWTLDAASRANSISNVVVTTDDPDIASIAVSAGAIVIKRPEALASDESKTIDAVIHAVESLEASGFGKIECVAILQPTSPLRTESDIDEAIRLFYANDKTPVCSVVRHTGVHPAKMYQLVDGGRIVPVLECASHARRQELPTIYRRNGAVYVIGQRELAQRTVFTSAMIPMLMPAERSLDIDTFDDIAAVEKCLRHSSAIFEKIER